MRYQGRKNAIECDRKKVCGCGVDAARAYGVAEVCAGAGDEKRLGVGIRAMRQSVGGIGAAQQSHSRAAGRLLTQRQAWIGLVRS